MKNKLILELKLGEKSRFVTYLDRNQHLAKLKAKYACNRETLGCKITGKGIASNRTSFINSLKVNEL